MLERMRQLDTMNEWAEGTLSKYGGKISRIQSFERQFGVRALVPSTLTSPPSTPAIPLIWSQLYYSLQPGKHKGKAITFDTARGLRSAASFFYQWDLQAAYPGQVVKDRKQSKIVNHSIPTDELVYTLQNGGMARRLGRSSNPSWSLQFTHVSFVERQLENMYQGTSDPNTRQEIAAAGAAHLLLWLGMLRGGECFALERRSVKIVPPHRGPEYGLPKGVGFIELRLLEETKTSPHKVADVVVAYTCSSGLSPGKWLGRLLSFPSRDGQHLFSTPKRKHWNSLHFRQNYLWPLLELQRLGGEASLKAFSQEPGHRIQDKIWSCHSYRRGFTSYVRRKRPEHFRKAAKGELHSHARWRYQGSIDIADLYDSDMDLEARVCFTLLCG